MNDIDLGGSLEDECRKIFYVADDYDSIANVYLFMLSMRYRFYNVLLLTCKMCQLLVARIDEKLQEVSFTKDRNNKCTLIF